ncbi:related to gEgh 16 protein [Cephalotrichum gorgonifer]|uniref:Related to gEgh 16 protein n=1 Tax=Cephalotrichum gorgonifer TaxID=2041049 RepID=A0AAE8N378_9PEZI|nr:related to gEgh 16 protein [Cephalotrichum gorgonifer]
MSLKAVLISCIVLAADLVAGHGAIISATGDAGGSGMALGIDTSTPRDGTRRRPFQQDTTRFRGNAADTVGETLGAGDNDVENGTQDILDETGDVLPQVTAGGEVSMTLHQVNGDGAGPYTCMINDDGTATSWQEITVTQNVPGRNGRDRDGEETDFPLTASIPANQECTGSVAGQDNVCLVRCQNPARAGPFGGVVPVQMATGNAGGNATEARRVRRARRATRPTPIKEHLE